MHFTGDGSCTTQAENDQPQQTNLRALDDETLGSKAASDAGAFATLYERYLCRIYGFVRSRTVDQATAEDLTAHVFFKALSFSSSFKGEGSYRSWIFQIARNTVASWRAGQRWAKVGLDEISERIDPSPTPATQAVAREDKNLLWRTVSQLPKAQQEVVKLRYLKDLTVEEIADLTRRSSGAVRVLLHRARNRLREMMSRDHITTPQE